ncbi:MAG: hypothetical protein IIV16_03310 [Alistipes sp.]|nr:hypothetical protein [Alistipes sp.]
MKQLIQHKKFVSYLLALLMVTAYSSRLYLTVNHEFSTFCYKTEYASSCQDEWLRCDCPICHAEDVVATEAEHFEYNPFFTTLAYEFAICPTAEANNIVTLSSLRGPPYLS